jgi:hypothetical protein
VNTHLDLLGLLYVVAAGLSTIVAVVLASLGAGAMSIDPRSPAGDGAWAAHVAGAMFLLLAAVLVVWSAVNAWVGRALRQRRYWARPAAMILGVLNLFILPFGTALGVYTLWVLLSDDVRQQFEMAAPPQASRPGGAST